MSEVKQLRARLQQLVRSVERTIPNEIDCEEVLDRISSYLEAVQDKRIFGEELEAVRQHLSVCPECTEEFEALRAALETEPNTTLEPRR